MLNAGEIPELESHLARSVARHCGVRLALLFGSRATGRAQPTSDIDLAVDAPEAELQPLAGALSLDLGAEVDVVSLRQSPIPLLEELVRESVVVYEAQPGAAAAWRSRVLGELETDRPWYRRMRDAWLRRVAERGSAMVNRDLLAAKLTELADRVARVRAHVPESVESLRGNRDALDLVAFNLMLSVQTCADIASHIIADEAWPAARSLAEGFTRLEEHGVLSARTAESLRGAIGLRNVVAHGYARLDVELYFQAATEGTTDLDAFARELTSWAAV